jgi:hypothetical protein
MGFARNILLTCLLSVVLFSQDSRANFGLHLGTHFGYGDLGNTSQTIPGRSASTFDLQAMPEWNFILLRAGLMMEYRWVNEFDRTYSGSSKLSGNSLSFGIAAETDPGPWKFLLGYDFKATHTLTAAQVSYYGSGYRLLAGYELLPMIRFDFQYTKTIYNQRKDNDGRSRLMDDDKLSHWNLAFGVSYTY